MSNKGSPKKHGLAGAERRRAKTTMRKRANKANNRVRQAERQAKIREAIATSEK